MVKKLSILICSLVERKSCLDGITLELNRQIVANSCYEEVEIVVAVDNREKTTGSKRNDLINQANGEYIVFVDDDDMVSDDYIAKTLAAIATKPDCCSLEGTIYFAGQNPRKFIHSLQYKEWFEKDGIYYRNPNHLNCVRKDLAKQVMFKDITFGEDRDFSMRLLPLLQTETVISGNIYNYYYAKPLVQPKPPVQPRVSNRRPPPHLNKNLVLKPPARMARNRRKF